MAESIKTTIDTAQYLDCLQYIEQYWERITCHYPRDKYAHFGLPKDFVCPSEGIYKNDQFYWDSYFTILGLVRCGRTSLAQGMIDNFIFMQKRFGIIPMRNRWFNLGGSQIPFLTSMIMEVYHSRPHKGWLKKAMTAAEQELKSYWMNPDLTELHLVYQGLSRYCDHYITHLAAEHESGWDMTSRFRDQCLYYLPVDLNSALFKYETDLAEYYRMTGNTQRYKQYLAAAEARTRAMNELMWNQSQGFFFDYNYKTKKRSRFHSLAGFYPMWAKMATHLQAKKMKDNLHLFEYDYGLANSQATGLMKDYRQHDYPNGWAPQHWIVIKGLMNYGFVEDAMRIAKKYLDLNNRIFTETGVLWEKYDVVKGIVSTSERYATQSGFGWTNAVFVRLISKFGNNGESVV